MSEERRWIINPATGERKEVRALEVRKNGFVIGWVRPSVYFAWQRGDLSDADIVVEARKCPVMPGENLGPVDHWVFE